MAAILVNNQMMNSSKQHSIPKLTFYRRLAGMLLALLITSALVAEDQVSNGTSAASPEAAGLRVYIDPETGELTGTPSPARVEALSKRLESPLSRSTEGLEPFELPRGGRGVFLDRRFQSALVVRLGADGVQEFSAQEFSCLNDPDFNDPGHAPPPVQEEWPEK